MVSVVGLEAKNTWITDFYGTANIIEEGGEFVLMDCGEAIARISKGTATILKFHPTRWEVEEIREFFRQHGFPVNMGINSLKEKYCQKQ